MKKVFELLCHYALRAFKYSQVFAFVAGLVAFTCAVTVDGINRKSNKNKVKK